jgi:hypothetical protein
MSKSKAQGGKGKRKNDGPAEKRYTAELRWLRNKDRAIARDKRRKAKIASSPKKQRVKATRDSRRLSKAA